MSVHQRIRTMENRHKGVLKPDGSVIITFKDGRLFDTLLNRFVSQEEINRQRYSYIVYTVDNGRGDYAR